MEKPVSVEIISSPKKEKKLRAVFKFKDGKEKTTDFGASGYKDFILYNKESKEKAKEKRKAYIARHEVNEDFNDFMSAGALSRWILWEKPTLKSAISAFKKRFNLK